jgi:hypothetical protein
MHRRTAQSLNSVRNVGLGVPCVCNSLGRAACWWAGYLAFTGSSSAVRIRFLRRYLQRPTDQGRSGSAFVAGRLDLPPTRKKPIVMIIEWLPSTEKGTVTVEGGIAVVPAKSVTEIPCRPGFRKTSLNHDILETEDHGALLWGIICQFWA